MVEGPSEPKNTIMDVKLADSRLIEYTRAFLRKADDQGNENGPWYRLVEAYTRLKDVINKYKEVTLQGDNVRYRPELTAEEREHLLIGHAGLNGEFNNGHNMVIQMRIVPTLQKYDENDNKNSVIKKLSQCINQLTVKSEDQSQLQKSLPGFGGTLVEKLGWVEAGGDSKNYKETARQALDRIEDEVAHWAAVNDDVLSGKDGLAVATQLAEYRSGLEELDKYLQQIESCRATVVPPPSPIRLGM